MTAEQEARDMLVRLGVSGADHWSAGEVVELANLLEERDALRKDAERWRKALSAYERGVVMSHDGRTGEVDGYVSLFLAAIRERDAAMAKEPTK